MSTKVESLITEQSAFKQDRKCVSMSVLPKLICVRRTRQKQQIVAVFSLLFAFIAISVATVSILVLALQQ